MAKTRPGKGRAVLKFIIGLLIAFIVCAGFYLFVSEYDLPGLRATKPTEPAGTPSPLASPQEPSGPADQGEPDALPPEETDGQQTAGPGKEADAPLTTPEPTAEPEPQRTESLRVEDVSVPEETKDAVFGMIDFKAADDTLNVSAYLSAPGISSENAQYYLVAVLANGRARYVYDTWPVENDTGLDIDLACFAGGLRGESLPDGWYRLGLMAVDGGESCFVAVADDSYSFVVSGGRIIRYAE